MPQEYSVYNCFNLNYNPIILTPQSGVFQYKEYASKVKDSNDKLGNPGTPNSIGGDDDPEINMEKLEKEANEVCQILCPVII